MDSLVIDPHLLRDTYVAVQWDPASHDSALRREVKSEVVAWRAQVGLVVRVLSKGDRDLAGDSQRG